MKQEKTSTIPLYCDFSCQHAAFSDPCAVGACRRDIGVWCKAARRYNNKHARCLLRPPGGEEAGADGAGTRRE